MSCGQRGVQRRGVVMAVVALLDRADPVGPHRRVMEQGRALRRRVPLRHPFEGIEQDVVGERHLIHREVAFKHAPVRTKLLNTVRQEGCHRLRQRVRADGLAAGIPVRAGPGHAEPSEFEQDIGALGHCSEAAAPRRQHLGVPVRVGANPQQATEVVEDDGQVGHGRGELRQLGELRKVQEGLEG